MLALITHLGDNLRLKSALIKVNNLSGVHDVIDNYLKIIINTRYIFCYTFNYLTIIVVPNPDLAYNKDIFILLFS